MRQNTENRFEQVLAYLALERMINRLRELEIPADAISWSRFFGALLLVILVLLFFSGAFMAFYYSSVPGTAYDSVDFAQFSVPFGDVVRGIHHYAWNLLLIVMGLHLLRAFILGAYKAPREFVWVSGVIVMLVVPFFIITGDLLPWDQKGYWSTQVRLSIVESVPVVGDLIVRILKGGPLTGIVALTRFYVLHILFLPTLLLLLLVAHFHFIGNRGLSGPLSGESALRKKVPFFPTIMNRWIIVFIIVTVALGFLARYWPAPFGDPADPTDSEYVPKPEWWVLFLNQLVAIFKGPLSVIGSVLIPSGLAGLTIALPFLDRSPERRPSKRMNVMIPATVVALILLGLSVIGYIEHFLSPLE